LTIFIVNQLFVEGVSDALRNAALDLSVNEQRIDDTAGVMDGDILKDLNIECFGIDFSWHVPRSL
jgi:hypothetical protein